MSQISPPMRILLVGSIVFLAAWFLVLKPGGGSDDVTPAAPAASTAGATTAPGKAAQAAHGAAQAAEAAGAARAGETTAVAPATSTLAAPNAAGGETESSGGAGSAGLPLSVAKAVASNKVLVLLFWNPKAADDRAVHTALRGVSRHKGAVKVHVANVSRISRYAPITRGVNVEQSPSVVVVDRNQQAQLLTGYADRVTIEQAVSDALRAGRKA